MASITNTKQIATRTVRLAMAVMVTTVVLFLTPAMSSAARLDEMSLDRWKKVREAERYQLKIAEKYYRERNWKIAQAEYEKFLTLYERSEAGSYSQLKWSICMRNLRKLNTAIKEGFQSVIDYWPESPDAVAASYYIANTYKQMGEIRKAKKAYSNVLKQYPKHLVAAYAAVDLIDIASVEKDTDLKVKMWKQLAFETERTRESRRLCENASRELAVHHFTNVALNEGVKALATTYISQKDLSTQVAAYARQPIINLTADSKTKSKGEKLADLAIAYFRQNTPNSKSSPEDKEVAKLHWYYIADMQAAARRTAKVPAVYDQIIKIFGTDDITLGRLAAWCKSVTRYDNARKVYAGYKNQIEGKSQIANSFREERKYNESVNTYRQLSLADAENSFKWIAQAAYTQRHYARNYKEAVKIYQELLKQDVENLDTWLWAVADSMHYAGMYKEAIQHFRQCSNNYPATHFRMAECQRALKQYNEAIILYSQIIGTEKGSAPEAQYQIARTLEQQGKKEPCILAYQKVCKQYPTTGQASRAHAHLQNQYKITVTLGGAKKDK